VLDLTQYAIVGRGDAKWGGFSFTLKLKHVFFKNRTKKVAQASQQNIWR